MPADQVLDVGTTRPGMVRERLRALEQGSGFAQNLTGQEPLPIPRVAGLCDQHVEIPGFARRLRLFRNRANELAMQP